MNESIKKVLGPVLIVGLFAAAGIVAYWRWPRHPHDTIRYPYVCAECKAVFDVGELKKQNMWRIAPGQTNESVVVCVRCNKGRAYPVSSNCEKCGTRRILHITKDSRCPKCFPEAAEAAKKAGVDVVFVGKSDDE